jgi:hypothetical protein
MKLAGFREIFKQHSNIINLIKIHPVAAELFRATEGQADMMKQIVVLRKLSKVLKSYKPKKLLKLRR